MMRDDYTRRIAELGSLADVLEGRADDAVQEMSTNVSYWNCNPANFTGGINNATGGKAGELAATFTPALARSLAGLVREKIAQWETEVVWCTDMCPGFTICPPGCVDHPAGFSHDGSHERPGCSRPIDAPNGERCTCFDAVWEAHNAYYLRTVSLDADR
jgi:hypothetical protein